MSTSNLEPAVETAAERNPSEGRHGFFPKLPTSEWVTYCLLAAVLAVTNIYTTLAIGWGDGGSIIAVIGAVMVLGAMRRRAHIQSLNLGQTLASAGGTVGFAATSYAAIAIAFPDYEMNWVLLTVMFFGMALIGVVIGSSVRKQMVRYYFPSGTACAVIQKTVTERGATAEAKRPVHLLAIWGAVAAAWCIPVKVAISKGGSALLSKIPLGSVKGTTLGIGLDPVGFGIGIVVGPRVGIGMIAGALAGPFILAPSLESAGEMAHFKDWLYWAAIAVLTMPTFATLLFAYLFRTPPSVPPGFRPGVTQYRVPPGRELVYAAFLIAGLGITAVTAQMLFDLSWWLVVLVVGACFPLAIMNGRVTGDTDINPVRLVIIVVMTLFALMISTTAVMLIGMVIIATMLAGMAVDMMQDYRTGYLVDANPTHQTSVQFIGVLIGVVVSVPFIWFLSNEIGFGPDTALKAPGPQIYAAMAKTYAGDAYFTTDMGIVVGIISAIGCGYAFLTVWPRTAAWMPSLFGAGIGMLLDFETCAAIFLGGMIKWGATMLYTRGKQGEARAEAANTANNETMIAGSAMFAAAALMTVLIILISKLTGGLIHLGH